jgi:hypothetical protein
VHTLHDPTPSGGSGASQGAEDEESAA